MGPASANGVRPVDDAPTPPECRFVGVTLGAPHPLWLVFTCMMCMPAATTAAVWVRLARLRRDRHVGLAVAPVHLGL